MEPIAFRRQITERALVAEERFGIRNKRAARLKATLLVSLDNADSVIEDDKRGGGMTTNEKPQGPARKRRAEKARAGSPFPKVRKSTPRAQVQHRHLGHPQRRLIRRLTFRQFSRAEVAPEAPSTAPPPRPIGVNGSGGRFP